MVSGCRRSVNFRISLSAPRHTAHYDKNRINELSRLCCYKVLPGPPRTFNVSNFQRFQFEFWIEHLHTYTQSETQSAEVHNVMTGRRRKSANINTTNEWRKERRTKEGSWGKSRETIYHYVRHVICYSICYCYCIIIKDCEIGSEMRILLHIVIRL